MDISSEQAFAIGVTVATTAAIQRIRRLSRVEENINLDIDSAREAGPISSNFKGDEFDEPTSKFRVEENNNVDAKSAQQKRKRPRVVFVTGSSGSGKTTLCQNLKRENGFVHFDVDMWTNGGDPIKNAGEAPDASFTKNLTQDIQLSIQTIVQKVYMNLWSNRKPDPTGWEQFYSLCLKTYAERKDEFQNECVIFDHAVYVRENRDYIRQLLGEDLIFLLLDTSPELLYDRIEKRTTSQAEANGMTLEQWVKSWNNGHTVDSVKKMWRRNITGFQPMQADEPNTFQIIIDSNVNVDDVLLWAQGVLEV